MTTRRTPLLPCLLLACAAGTVRGQAPGTLDADLRAKSIDTRLAAIDAAATSGRADLDRILLPLLNDKDWEIQERTAIALGKAKCKPALKALVELAVDGDVSRIRRAAAAAAGEIDGVEATATLFKKAKGKTQVLAQEAIAIANRRQPPFAEADKLKKLMREADRAVRESAAAAWLECAADRPDAVRTLLSEPFLVVRCRALDAIAEAPRPEDLKPLADALRGGAQHEVVERRLLRALAAVILADTGDRAMLAETTLDGAGSDTIPATRCARLVPLLARGDKPALEKKAAVLALKKPLSARDAAPRAAAAKALREVGGEDALAAALAQMSRESDRRAVLQLVESVVALRPLTTPEAVSWLTDIAGKDVDEAVQERAIVLLGRSGIKGAAATLVGQLEHSRWTTGSCAAVSLGKTDDDAALAPLLKLLQHKDWQRRGAAVVGLMHWNRAEVVEPLIGMLADQNTVVAGAANAALQTISLKFDGTLDAKAWRAWWAQNKDKHQFVDRAQSIDKIKKYGYAVPDTEIYQGLDVIAFASRGDHIEQLLERLKIAHRATEAGKIPQCGIHPEAIFVSNCTGEIQPEDVEPLAWFVRTGGSLFGSCWALTETIARIHPGVVQKAQTRDQVLDDVRALPCRAESPLLNGVFAAGVVPIYHLEGAHLIDVLDHDRCEVLIDSPDAAERWGNGNLAAWFFSGHGVVFDSANHFDLQGFDSAPGLKTDKERQAWAVDHMGLSLDKWRTTRTEGYWKQGRTAGKSVPDLSAFRLVTNFVRSKRMAEY